MRRWIHVRLNRDGIYTNRRNGTKLVISFYVWISVNNKNEIRKKTIIFLSFFSFAFMRGSWYSRIKITVQWMPCPRALSLSLHHFFPFNVFLFSSLALPLHRISLSLNHFMAGRTLNFGKEQKRKKNMKKLGNVLWRECAICADEIRPCRTIIEKCWRCAVVWPGRHIFVFVIANKTPFQKGVS